MCPICEQSAVKQRPPRAVKQAPDFTRILAPLCTKIEESGGDETRHWARRSPVMTPRTSCPATTTSSSGCEGESGIVATLSESDPVIHTSQPRAILIRRTKRGQVIRSPGDEARRSVASK